MPEKLGAAGVSVSEKVMSQIHKREKICFIVAFLFLPGPQ